MKTDLKFYAVTSTKDSHQIPKSQVSLTESLKLDSYLPKKLFIWFNDSRSKMMKNISISS